ncbi:Hypothetical predicted protein [Mytilus galloprovincialis]|uniref:Uncharacterized protein n=1 Tax=Mytilus galloprovincialis TaxID=29158 RepID=A0A8B6HJB1_MYTGA|nr:Hypothetical predicted protein [Mytilus galloprovincialis]
MFTYHKIILPDVPEDLLIYNMKTPEMQMMPCTTWTELDSWEENWRLNLQEGTEKHQTRCEERKEGQDMVVGMIMTDEEAADDTDQGAEAQDEGQDPDLAAEIEGDPGAEVVEGNHTVILKVDQGQGHMIEKEVVIGIGRDLVHIVAQPHDHQERMTEVEVPLQIIESPVFSMDFIFIRTCDVGQEQYLTDLMYYICDNFMFLCKNNPDPNEQFLLSSYISVNNHVHSTCC